ncbi:hypothetical protein HA402_000506 [Bradysia odoriphaga]|nr:hypothetical protein HA402_000506 [Bradysia odoriphaga]
MEEVMVASKINSVEDLNDEQFLEIFKISRTVFMFLFGEIKRHFKPPRLKAVTPMTRLACCLQILSNKKLNQNVLRQNVSICPSLSVSQPVVSRSVDMVLTVFEKKICPKWIKFPTTDADIAKCKERFFDETGLTNVIGCVACLNISVLPFINNQERFGNADGVQSINVQVVCDYDTKILSVDPRYPGGVPATDIWSVSTEKDELERCYRNGSKHILLGGPDYTLEPWLITPFLPDALLTKERINFNHKHAQAHKRILKCLSILQDRFEILQSSRYLAEKTTKIVNACCALYNIFLEHGCFNDQIDVDDSGVVNNKDIKDSLHCQIDGPDRNPYYNFGSDIRDEMMLHLSE